jgi:hypothetical protein
MKDIDKMGTETCPHCGGGSASTVITERYTLSVDFTGLPYGQSDNKIVSGGKGLFAIAAERMFLN